MARFRMTNHLIPADKPGHTQKIDSNMGAFQRIITGLVSFHQGADQKQLEHDTIERLCSMPAGKTEVFRHTQYYHLSIKRLPDEPIFITDLNTPPERLPEMKRLTEEYLAQFPKKRLVDYHCPACKAALQLVKPPSYETWDSMASCYHCGQAFHYQIRGGESVPLINFREQEDFS